MSSIFYVIFVNIFSKCLKRTVSLKDRFKIIFSELKLSQTEIASKLSIDVRKLRSYVYETKNYPVDFLQSLIYVFNVNINWLLTGQGNIFIENKPSTDDKQLEQKVVEVMKKYGVIEK